MSGFFNRHYDSDELDLAEHQDDKMAEITIER